MKKINIDRKNKIKSGITIFLITLLVEVVSGLITALAFNILKIDIFHDIWKFITFSIILLVILISFVYKNLIKWKN